MRIPNKTDAELRELALALVAGHLVTDRDVPPSLYFSVFFPAAGYAMQGGPEAEAWLGELGLVYGDRNKHRTMGGRAVNGFPMFAEVGVLNKADTAKLYATAKRLWEASQVVEVG
jgi:hypothetical protein